MTTKLKSMLALAVTTCAAAGLAIAFTGPTNSPSAANSSAGAFIDDMAGADFDTSTDSLAALSARVAALEAGSGAIVSVQHVSKSLNIGATGDVTVTLPTAVIPGNCTADVDGVLVQWGGSLHLWLEVTGPNELTIHKDLVSGWNDPTNLTFNFTVVEWRGPNT